GHLARRSHSEQRASNVTVQLAKVGDARVRREPGGYVHHLLERRTGGGVPTESDERVADHPEDGSPVRIEATSALAVAERAGEVMARRRERREAHVRAGVVIGMGPERRGEHRIGFRVVTRISGDPRLLYVG